MTAIADYRNADELIKDHFKYEEVQFENMNDELRVAVREWVYSAYLQGLEEGYNSGTEEGYNSGYAEGREYGYDEGYDDAQAECEDEW